MSEDDCLCPQIFFAVICGGYGGVDGVNGDDCCGSCGGGGDGGGGVDSGGVFGGVELTVLVVVGVLLWMSEWIAIFFLKQIDSSFWVVFWCTWCEDICDDVAQCWWQKW